MSKQSDSGLKKLIGIPATLGITIGILAAFLQALLASSGGPEAYGFCVACHTRDLADSIFNWLTPEGIATLFVAPFSAPYSVWTPLGVLLGAFAAAKMSKEFRVKKASLVTYLLYFIGGIAIMWFGLILGACPYRAALRLGYGDMVALIGILSIVLGVFVGTRIVLKKMEKEEV